MLGCCGPDDGSCRSSSSEPGGVRPKVTIPAELLLFLDAFESTDDSLSSIPSSIEAGLTRFLCRIPKIRNHITGMLAGIFQPPKNW